jgi:hypothetical protein
MGNKSRLIVGGLGVTALAAVGIVSYAPEWLPAIVTTGFTTLERLIAQRWALLGGAALLGAYGLWRHYNSRSLYTPSALGAASDAPALVADREVGAAYTQTVADTEATIADATTMDDAAVVQPLRTALIDLFVARGWSRDRATAHVDTGAWTDNRTIAVFLGTDAAGDYAFLYRVYAWLLPERAFRHRVQTAIDEIAACAAADHIGATETSAAPPTAAAGPSSDADHPPASSPSTSTPAATASPDGNDQP